MYAQLENEVLSSIADKKKVIGEKIKINSEQSRQFLNHIKQQLAIIENVEKFGTNEHVLLLKRKIEKESVCRLKSTVGELENNKSKYSFKCVEDTSFDSLLMEMKNTLRIEDFTCDVRETGSDIDSSHYKPYTERILQLKYNTNLRIIPMFDKAKYIEPRSCIWIDKFIVLSLRIVNALLVIKEDSDFVMSKFKCDSIPWSVSKTGPTEMVITLPCAGKIAFARLRNGNVHVVTELKTRIPYCDVTRNDQLNQYICLAWENGQIDLLNNTGTLLREINVGSDVIEFGQSCTINACNLLYIISNCSSDKLMALNLNGEKVFGYNHENLIGPGQIAVDPSGNIYVTSIEGSLNQISPSGKFIRSLSLSNGICGMDYPTGLCFNRKFDKIALSCGVLDKPYLQVYTFT
ncbi:hypothetical protein DPMN_077238 [Dreissena polymorpha]|uniref:Uncharacterized protein n=1 Tax=Dreissena polymorpha TaxID=45954 RepID=A0A9D3YNV7_DREPO|nr:hypothetical protein DPMN_077238 [Dreissena polymorpha]